MWTGFHASAVEPLLRCSSGLGWIRSIGVIGGGGRPAGSTGVAKGTAAYARRSAAGWLADCPRVSATHGLLVHCGAVQELPVDVMVFLLVDDDRLFGALGRESNDSAAAETLAGSGGVAGGAECRRRAGRTS